MRILVADDNVDSADCLARLLKIAGHELRVAYDGPTALAFATNFQPQVVLLDIGIPGLNGYEVAQRLRLRGQKMPRLWLLPNGDHQKISEGRERLGLTTICLNRSNPKLCNNY